MIWDLQMSLKNEGFYRKVREIVEHVKRRFKNLGTVHAKTPKYVLPSIVCTKILRLLFFDTWVSKVT
jgi:hypothetical protein